MTAQVTLQLEAYDKAAKQLISSAQGLADERKNPEVEPIHLLYRLVERDAEVQAAVQGAGAPPTDVLVEAELGLRRLPRNSGGAAYLSPRFLDLLGRAEGEAARAGGVPVSVAHLLLAAAQEQSGAVHNTLSACGLSAPILRSAFGSGGGSVRSGAGGGVADPLERYGSDLTRAAAQGRLDPIVGRDAELRRLLQVLARRYGSSPLLVGEAGIGKHSIVCALAQRIASGDVPAMLNAKRVVELDVAAISAGARLRGELEERVQSVLASLRDAGGATILYVRDLHGLLDERNGQPLATLLSSALRALEFQMIAVADPATAQRLESTASLLRTFVRIDVEAPNEAQAVAILRGLVHRFEMAHGLNISDPALTSATRLAKRYVPSVQLPKSAIELVDEAAALVRVEMESVPQALDQAERRLENLELQLRALANDHDPASTRTRGALQAEADRLRPETTELRKRWHGELHRHKRIKELKEELAAAERELEQSEERQRRDELRFGALPELQKQLQALEAEPEGPHRLLRDSVSEADVATVVAQRTGVPVERMLEEEAQKLLRMEERLSQRVVGQDEAVAALAKAVRRGRVGLRDPKRPIGSFLFLGTTGVGKTELAKAVAEFLFDDEAALTRLDMSEFMEKHTVARLLGSPPGYVDSEEGGFLTEAVRRRPYSVLLFDEIEKAHPDVFNILLQVLDDGRLTDSRGRMAHFADTVIILTSNIGARKILEHGGDGDNVREAVQEELRATLRPEFLNRIDDIVVFSTLDKAGLRKIVDIQLRMLERLLAPRQLSLSLSEEAKGHLVELGYEPAFGARPLRRVIRRELQDPLAQALLTGGFGAGQRIEVGLREGKLWFESGD